MDARAAAIAAGIRRRRRALFISLPSFRSARATGIGSIPGRFLIRIFSVHLYGHYNT